MSRRGAWEPVAAIVGLLVLAAVGVWWWFEVLEPPRAPVPGYKGQPFAALSAAMPEIAQFEGFYINDDNPFVPWREREAEKKRMQQPAAVVVKARPPAKIEPITPPVLKLPPKSGGGGDAPKVVGFTRRPDGSVDVLVNLPGENRPRLMKPGEKAGRWTFAAIEDGNVVLFADETGRQYRLVIGGRP
jgi:hypothetical protein